MDEETKVLRDYLMFTVPHVTVLAGAILGILMIIGVPVNVALGIFAIVYGLMLTVLGLVIRPHVSGILLYRLSMAFFVGLVVVGAVILLYGG
ncbi:hypothetical protein A3L11_03250 [Thermococcus siculi]|uniref:Uncharacterized protein n=2 Tax=Thermococcus siculi TaxID=72803 RepID=A0A2Z2MNR2_9EURY|nr:hypothetical protein [Thermococcus siculi]ASJ08297.1 hypothetical protein A3L11_03250 [Thermococcus siculi]